MSKKLKPLTIFLSDDELVNFKSHFDEFLNMNCDDKVKEQQQKIRILEEEIERLKNINEEHRILNGELRKELQEKENIIKEVREYIESYMPNYDFDKTNLIKLLEILQGSEKE